MVPEIRFGIATGDPAAGDVHDRQLPGRVDGAAEQRARALRAAHRPRQLRSCGNARLNEDTNQYEYLGNGFQRGTMRQWGFYAQDNWRVRNNLTINAGLRYELQTAVRVDEQQLLDGDARRRVRHLGHRRRRAVQPVQAGHADRPHAASTSTTRRARRRSTPTGTTSRRASA